MKKTTSSSYTIPLNLVFSVNLLASDVYIIGPVNTVCNADHFSQCIKQDSNTHSSTGGSTKEQEIYELADRIFYENHPELSGKKIQSSENRLKREWHKIHACEAVVDYELYRKHPELDGRKIYDYEESLRGEWLAIKKKVRGCRK